MVIFPVRKDPLITKGLFFLSFFFFLRANITSTETRMPAFACSSIHTETQAYKCAHTGADSEQSNLGLHLHFFSKEHLPQDIIFAFYSGITITSLLAQTPVNIFKVAGRSLSNAVYWSDAIPSNRNFNFFFTLSHFVYCSS